ncbi:MAG: oxidoreductase, partial [Ekhidna sp.]
MKQVFLSGKGQVELVDAPIPGRMNGSILIRNSHSVISAGTEGAAVTTNEGVYGLIEKVSSSKDRVDQVWDMVKKQGLSQTMTAVNSKLADYTPIGYSCSGVVLENDDSNSEFKVGDRVACMGAG